MQHLPSCKAKYEGDDVYYDASLMQVVDDLAHVLYSGYDESAWVSLDDVQKIASQDNVAETPFVRFTFFIVFFFFLIDKQTHKHTYKHVHTGNR